MEEKKSTSENNSFTDWIMLMNALFRKENDYVFWI